MFQKISHYIGIVVIALVLLGHHSFQVYAMGTSLSLVELTSYVDHHCHHGVDVNICEKIQSDEMQIGSDIFLLTEVPQCLSLVVPENKFPLNENSKVFREKIPISYKQLARSHC